LENGLSSTIIVDLCAGLGYKDRVIKSLSFDELNFCELACIAQMRFEDDQFHRGVLLRLVQKLSDRSDICSPLWEGTGEDFFNRSSPVNPLELRVIAASEDVQHLDMFVDTWESICSRYRAVPWLGKLTPLQQYGQSRLSEVFPRRQRLTVLEFLCERVSGDHNRYTDGFGLRFATWEKNVKSLIEAMRLHNFTTTAFVVEDGNDDAIEDRTIGDLLDLSALPRRTMYSLCIHQRITEALQEYSIHVREMNVPECLISVKENERLETLIHVHANAKSALRLIDELKLLLRYSTWIEQSLAIVHRHEAPFQLHRYHVLVGAAQYDDAVGDNLMEKVQATTMYGPAEAYGSVYLEIAMVDQRTYLFKEAAIALIATETGNHIPRVVGGAMDALNEVSIHDVLIGLMGSLNGSEGTDESATVRKFVDYMMTDLNLVGGFREGIRGILSKQFRSLVHFGVYQGNGKRAVLDSRMRSTLVAQVATHMLTDPHILTLFRGVADARVSAYTIEVAYLRNRCKMEAAFDAADVMHKVDPVTGHLENFFEYEMAVNAVYTDMSPTFFTSGNNQLQLSGVYGIVEGPLGACQIIARWMTVRASTEPVRSIYDNIRLASQWIFAYAKRLPGFDIRSSVYGLCDQLGLVSILNRPTLTYLHACVRLQSNMSVVPQHQWIMLEWQAQMKLQMQSHFPNLTCPRSLRASVDTPVHFGPDDIDMMAANATLLRSLLAGGGDVISQGGVADEVPITNGGGELVHQTLMMMTVGLKWSPKHRMVADNAEYVFPVNSDVHMTEQCISVPEVRSTAIVIDKALIGQSLSHAPVLLCESDVQTAESRGVLQSGPVTPKRKTRGSPMEDDKRVMSWRCVKGQHFAIDKYARSSPYGVRWVDFDASDDGSVVDPDQEWFDKEVEQSLGDQCEAAEWALEQLVLEEYLHWLELYSIKETYACLKKSMPEEGLKGSPLLWLYGQTKPSLEDLQNEIDAEGYFSEHSFVDIDDVSDSSDSFHSGMYIGYAYDSSFDGNSSVTSDPVTALDSDAYVGIREYLSPSIQHYFDEFISDPRNAAKRVLQYPMLDYRIWFFIYLARRIRMTGIEVDLVMFGSLIVLEWEERQCFSSAVLLRNGLQDFSVDDSYVFLATIQYAGLMGNDVLDLNVYSNLIARSYNKDAMATVKFTYDVNDEEAYLIKTLLMAAKKMSSALHFVNVSDWNQPILGISLLDLRAGLQASIREEIAILCSEAHVLRVNGEHCSHDALYAAYGEYCQHSTGRYCIHSGDSPSSR